MKLLLTTAALLLSVAAHATPKMGDYSEFQFTISNGSQSAVGSYIMAIVSESGDQFSVTTTVHFDGQADQYEEQKQARGEFIDDSTITNVLANCHAYGGESEQLVVPAGTIPSCKVPIMNDGQPAGSSWIAMVPFGIAKQVQLSEDGTTYTLELKKFIAGQ